MTLCSKTNERLTRSSEALLKYARKHYLILLIFGSLVARFLIVFNGGLSLFNSGQDAPSYETAAFDFARKGFWSSEIESLPVWPAGYPFLLSLFILLFGDNWWKFVIFFQHALYLTAGVYFLKTMRTSVSTIQHVFLSCLILFLPSLVYSASENMYESVLASLLLLGVAASHSIYNCNTHVFPLNGYALAILSFGLAGFVQAKAAPIGFIILLFVTRGRHTRSLVFAVLSLWGALLTMLRSWVAYGIYSPSVNYSIALSVSGAKVDKCSYLESDTLSAIQNSAIRDREVTLCVLENFLRDPSEMLNHVWNQARALFGPLNGGGVGGASTWFHGLDFSRFSSYLGLRNTDTIFLIQNSYALALNLAIIAGSALIIRRYHWRLALTILLPILIFSLVHLFSDGDARYRLPILPFQMLCLSYSLDAAYRFISRRAKSFVALGRHNQSNI